MNNLKFSILKIRFNIRINIYVMFGYFSIHTSGDRNRGYVRARMSEKVESSGNAANITCEKFRNSKGALLIALKVSNDPIHRPSECDLLPPYPKSAFVCPRLAVS